MRHTSSGKWGFIIHPGGGMTGRINGAAAIPTNVGRWESCFFEKTGLAFGTVEK